MAAELNKRNANQKDECCPGIDPAQWDGKLLEWTDKKFIKSSVFTFFYIPIRFGAVMRRLDEKVQNAGATVPDGLALYDHTSKWNMDVYLSVDKEVPGAENTTLSGKFLFKIYEGDYKDTGKWCRDFENYARAGNFKIEKWYMWYATCPECAKKYGKNYVAVIGKVG